MTAFPTNFSGFTTNFVGVAAGGTLTTSLSVLPNFVPTSTAATPSGAQPSVISYESATTAEHSNRFAVALTPTNHTPPLWRDAKAPAQDIPAALLFGSLMLVRDGSAVVVYDQRGIPDALAGLLRPSLLPEYISGGTRPLFQVRNTTSAPSFLTFIEPMTYGAQAQLGAEGLLAAPKKGRSSRGPRTPASDAGMAPIVEEFGPLAEFDRDPARGGERLSDDTADLYWSRNADSPNFQRAYELACSEEGKDGTDPRWRRAFVRFLNIYPVFNGDGLVDPNSVERAIFATAMATLLSLSSSPKGFDAGGGVDVVVIDGANLGADAAKKMRQGELSSKILNALAGKGDNAAESAPEAAPASAVCVPAPQYEITPIDENWAFADIPAGAWGRQGWQKRVIKSSLVEDGSRDHWQGTIRVGSSDIARPHIIPRTDAAKRALECVGDENLHFFCFGSALLSDIILPTGERTIAVRFSAGRTLDDAKEYIAEYLAQTLAQFQRFN